MFVSGYWRCVNVCKWILEVCSVCQCILEFCSCVSVDTGGLFMFVGTFF